MDSVFHDVRTRFSTALQSRISNIPRHFENSRIPRTAWIAVAALILGIWANHGSQAEGKLAWLRANPPTLETWKTVLEKRGFSLIEDSAWREKAFVEMPDSSRMRDSTLVTEDHTTVALRTDGDWLYFGLLRNGNGGKAIPRGQWENLGLGWAGIARFEALPLPQFEKSAEKPKNHTEWTDSRSLNY